MISRSINLLSEILWSMQTDVFYFHGLYTIEAKKPGGNISYSGEFLEFIKSKQKSETGSLPFNKDGFLQVFWMDS